MLQEVVVAAGEEGVDGLVLVVAVAPLLESQRGTLPVVVLVLHLRLLDSLRPL